MKYSPKFLLYIASIDYLNEVEKKDFNFEFKSKIVKRNDSFFKIFNKFIDVEVFNNQQRKEDILIYNYLKYEVKNNKLSKKGLIEKYEKLVVLPLIEKNPDLMQELFQNGVYYLINS
jgi:hypothetical protein